MVDNQDGDVYLYFRHNFTRHRDPYPFLAFKQKSLLFLCVSILHPSRLPTASCIHILQLSGVLHLIQFFVMLMFLMNKQMRNIGRKYVVRKKYQKTAV